MNNIGIVLALVVGIGMLYAVYHIGQSVGVSRKQENEDKEQHATYLKEILTRDREIQTIRGKLDDLSQLNDRYLSFLVRIPTVVQRLNATLKVEEIISSVLDLVTEIIPTKVVECYILDSADNLLKKVSSMEEEQRAIGEGMIGIAAQQRMVMSREHFQKMQGLKETVQEIDSHLWMAVPIQFKDRMLGVIGIGAVTHPAGNEIDLMKMIADIAGVALLNQTMLGEAKHKANTDSLTGLNNRNYLFHMAQNFVEKAIREGTPISLFLFDIDNFKHYNDTNGHDDGDRLLQELSEIVRTVTRKNSVIVRYGGEEFIVMLPGINKEDAFIYAERLREKISLYPFAHRETQPLGYVSISGGVASFPFDGESIYKIIQLADMALYKAKAEGRNRVIMHKPYLFSESESEKDQLTIS
ncbi:MAG: diguanylate cyclase [Nitrospirae bacterium]|nr:diguanylate cyclase [Nitrospirota bacterium]